MIAFIKLFDLIPGIVYVVIITALTAFSGVSHWRANAAHLELIQARAQAAEATAQAQQAARAKEQALRQQVERIATHALERDKDRNVQLAAAQRTAASLRDVISSLNARPAPADPRAAAFAHEAATARELLGSCAQEYRAVAASADELSDQVTGLQEYASSVKSHD